jgi:polysaccharide export outer membrane protein
MTSMCAAEDYRLKIGDMLHLTIYDQSGTARAVEIDTTGAISYLYLNAFPAAGKTIDEFRSALSQELSKYYRNPLLTITLSNSQGNFYTIMGEVTEPGAKPIVGEMTVLTALCQARGIVQLTFRDQLTEFADLDHAFVARDGEYLPIDFERLVRKGDLSQDIPLLNGDYIYIPSMEVSRIFVLGEVQYPLTIEYLGSKTLAQAVAEAGGTLPRASSRVLVLRGSLSCPKRYLVDFNRIVKGDACDFPLCPGDIVYVPPMKFSTIKEIAQLAVASFVSIVASTGGTNAYLHLNPNAFGQISSPVPSIPVGTGTGAVTSPGASIPSGL